ncbi:MAG: hypothetical protein AAF202_05305 [Pseudomonadota bacterium]
MTELIELQNQGQVISLKYRHGTVSLFNLSSTLSFSNVTRLVFRSMNLAASIVLAHYSDIEQDVKLVLVDEMLGEDNKPLSSLSTFDEAIDGILISTVPLLRFANASKLSPMEAAVLVVALQVHKVLIVDEQIDEGPQEDSTEVAVRVLKTVFPSSEGRIQIGQKVHSISEALPLPIGPAQQP